MTEYDDLRAELDALPAPIADEPDPSSPLAALAAMTAPASMRDIEAALRAMIAGVDGEDTLALRSMRTDAIEILTRLEVRGAAGLVDAALALRPPPKKNQGAVLEIDDPAPWPTPVDGAELLEDLAAIYRRYLVLPDGADDVLAIWTVHTYLMGAWEHTGYLALISATRRCGKSTAITIVTALASRALSADDISAAALYRTIEAWAPTLLVDELDRIDRDADIWAIINSGHSRGRTVIRTVGDEHEPRAFSTWSPKVLAYIRGPRCPVPDTVEDRSIIIHLARRRPSDRRERLRSRTLTAETAPLRRRLVRWADDHALDLGGASPEIPAVLDDRAADSWEALLAIAGQVGGRWPARARELAVAYSATRTEDERESASVRVVCDLAELLADGRLRPDAAIGGGQHLVAGDMCASLRALDERPWSTWGRDRQGLTAESLSRLLRPHDIRSVQAGARGERVRRYLAPQIRAAAERYELPDTHPPCEHVGSTRSPAHGGSRPPVSDRADWCERVSGLDPLTGGRSDTDTSPDPLTRRPYTAPTMTRVAAPRELVERLLASPTVVTDPDLIAEWRALRGGSERAAEGELF